MGTRTLIFKSESVLIALCKIMYTQCIKIYILNVAVGNGEDIYIYIFNMLALLFSLQTLPCGSAMVCSYNILYD